MIASSLIYLVAKFDNKPKSEIAIKDLKYDTKIDTLLINQTKIVTITDRRHPITYYLQKLTEILPKMKYENDIMKNETDKPFHSDIYFIRYILGISTSTGTENSRYFGRVIGIAYGGKKTRKQPRNKKPNAGRRTRSNKK